MSLVDGVLLREPDYAIRYAIWRLCTLARGQGPSTGPVWRLRLVAPQEVGEQALGLPELVIEGHEGEILERVCCEELHETFVPLTSVRRFLERAARARAPEVPTRIRWVSNARLLKLSPEARIWDLADPDERRELLAEAGLDRYDGGHVVWDLGRHSVSQLTSESLFHLSQGAAADDREIYQDLYESLRAQLERAAPPRDASSRQRLLLFLYGELISRQPEPVASPGEVAFWRRHLLPPPGSEPAPPPIDPEHVVTALRRGLFLETEVTLAQIYVPQKANLSIPDEEGRRSLLWSGEAHELLFWWLAEARRRPPKPLLVLGSFGSGKSSLLTVFAQSLIETASPVVPILIPLRDLTGAGTAQPLKQVLVEHVRDRWGVDLEAPDPSGRRYCLLCDGFDELNLYYQAVATVQWVGECFRSLGLLAARSDLEVVISSRPVLLMDVTHRDYEGADCPRLDLELFDRPEVEQWCVNYRRAAGLDDFLTTDQLEERDLLEVARTPLILYMMARLHEFEETAFQEPRRYTRAEIYRRFVDWTQRGGYRSDKTKHELPRDFRSILRSIGWYFFEHGDGFVEEESLLQRLRSVHGAELDRVPIDRNILVAHMLQPIAEPGGDDRHLIEFTHQSFREYLVAEWLWERLEGVRQGGDLDAGLWGGLSHKMIPANEVRFLADMISELRWQEAVALYRGLADTENVHQYWIKWLQPTWEELRSDLRLEVLEEVVHKVGVTASRACNLATLGFLLRAKSYARLRELARAGDRRDLPGSLSAETLGRLLHLLKTFPSQGVGAENLSILIAQLDGLVLSGTALEGQHLNSPNFRGSSMRGINFSGSRWLEADLQGADLSESSFNYSLLTLKATDGAKFVGSNFSDAILTHPKNEPISGVDFSKAEFRRTRLLDLTVVESRFAGNIWDGAGRLYSREKRPSILIRCELDERAERFFRGEGFTLEDCARVEVEGDEEMDG